MDLKDYLMLNNMEIQTALTDENSLETLKALDKNTALITYFMHPTNSGAKYAVSLVNDILSVINTIDDVHDLIDGEIKAAYELAAELDLYVPTRDLNVAATIVVGTIASNKDIVFEKDLYKKEIGKIIRKNFLLKFFKDDIDFDALNMNEIINNIEVHKDKVKDPISLAALVMCKYNLNKLMFLPGDDAFIEDVTKQLSIFIDKSAEDVGAQVTALFDKILNAAIILSLETNIKLNEHIVITTLLYRFHQLIFNEVEQDFDKVADYIEEFIKSKDLYSIFGQPERIKHMRRYPKRDRKKISKTYGKNKKHKKKK